MARVLIVDDDAAVVTAERQVLERDGHEVTTAASGAEALARLQEQTFGMVLLDINMPDVDGLQVMTAMRKDPRHRHTPVLVLSGRLEAEAVRDTFKAGGSLFLNKPFSAVQLSRLVSAMARG